MTPGELLSRDALKWLGQAGKDRIAAQALLEAEPSRSVFHSQQAAEKALKGFLTYRQVAFRRTHDLTDLGTQCLVVDATLEPILREVEGLTDYATAFRYPDAPWVGLVFRWVRVCYFFGVGFGALVGRECDPWGWR